MSKKRQPGGAPDRTKTKSSVRQRAQDMIDALQQSGHRLTPQRLAVIDILAASDGHPGVDRIYEQVLRKFPTTSLATIYKTVNLLKELGQVLELGFADWGSRYDGHKPYPHPHVICTRCGRVVDPEFAPMADLARTMARKSGFEITHHRLDFFGLCPVCRERS
jgi:Fur family peroxide stress response transcriptional regulator